MTSKTAGLGLAFLILVSCASMQVKRQEANSYEHFSFDAVWNAALEAAKDMGYTIKESDKGVSLPAFSEQKGHIFAEGEKGPLPLEEPPQLHITIERKKGKVFVNCQAIQPKRLIDFGKSKKNVKKFFEYLNRKLNK
jgi:hypothetical protein